MTTCNHDIINQDKDFHKSKIDIISKEIREHIEIHGHDNSDKIQSLKECLNYNIGAFNALNTVLHKVV